MIKYNKQDKPQNQNHRRVEQFQSLVFYAWQFAKNY